MKKEIYPCLWFNGNAGEAAAFYCSVFEDSSIVSENHLVVTFTSSGQKFMCLNGGTGMQFNPSISFYVICRSEEEIDKACKTLLEGGEEMMPLGKYDWSEKYAWLKDKFGISWQLSFGGREKTDRKFTPAIMFTGAQGGRAEEAVRYYTSLFERSEIKLIARYEDGENDIKGNIKHSQFNLANTGFMAMDSSYPHKFVFNETISFVVECETQEEIDFLWERLTEGGVESQCGWLKDKFGVSWQIIPEILEELMNDPTRSERVINAFLKMKKFEIDKLLKA